MQNHKFSEEGKAFLKNLESFRSLPYDDQTGDPITEWVLGATIGYGHLISRSEWDAYAGKYLQGIDEETADKMMDYDLAPFILVVNKSVTVPVNQNQFDALVLLTYNIGTGFKISSVLKLVNDPEAKTPYPDLKSAWLAWNKSQGKVMRGLTKRRLAEYNMYSLDDIMDPAVKPKSKAMVSLGSHNHKEVIEVQKVLGLTQDGIFGNNTLSAVKEFQAIHRLPSDGIVGKNTYRAMGLL